MRKFIFLLLFICITVGNVVLVFLLRETNSSRDLTFSQETLDFSREFGVTIDIEFLKENLQPAYE